MEKHRGVEKEVRMKIEIEYCAHCEYNTVDKIWVCRNDAVPYGCVRETGGVLPHKDCIMEFKVK